MNDQEQLRVQREINLKLGYMVQYPGLDMPDFAELNPKLFTSLGEDFTENHPNRPTLVED
jgi:hypothetical protein